MYIVHQPSFSIECGGGSLQGKNADDLEDSRVQFSMLPYLLTYLHTYVHTYIHSYEDRERASEREIHRDTEKTQVVYHIYTCRRRH